MLFRSMADLLFLFANPSDSVELIACVECSWLIGLLVASMSITSTNLHAYLLTMSISSLSYKQACRGDVYVCTIRVVVVVPSLHRGASVDRGCQ